MLAIVHSWMNEQWDKTGLSLEKIRNKILEKHPEQSISISKLHRIFSDPDCKVSVEEILLLAEAFAKDPNELFAKIGGREYQASEGVDYKGAEALLRDFAREKEEIRQEYEVRITQSIKAREDTQQAFQTALAQIGEQYRANADYLTGIIKENETYIRDLLSKTERANIIAEAAQKRAEEAEKAREIIDKRRHQVFWGMIVIVFALLGLLFSSFILNIPSIGWGNL